MSMENASPDLSRLVPISEIKVGGVLTPTCNARELHDYLGVKRDFSNWIKARIAKYGFTEGVDYVTSEAADLSPNLAKNTPAGRGRPEVDYFLTLDMAKELAMVENNDMGRRVRRYFIECERRGSQIRAATMTAPIPTDPAWAEWLTLSTDERRTRQRDILIDCRLYGQAGGRYTAHQVGHPIPPRWVLTAGQQHELELARQQPATTITVVVPTPGAG